MHISKNVKYYYVADVLTYSAGSLVTVFLTILITNKISQGSIEAIGFMISYYLIFSAIVSVIFTRLYKKRTTDRNRKIVAYGFLSTAAMLVMLGNSTTIWQIATIISLMGVIDGIQYPIQWATFSKILDKNSEEFEWGVESFLTSVAGAVMAAFSGFIGDKFGIEVVFYMFAFFYAISAFLFYKIKKQRKLFGFWRVGF